MGAWGSGGDRLAAVNGVGCALFAYGTLQFPQMLEVLLGRVPEFTPAAAVGWRAAALPGLLYPGLVPHPGAVAPGVVITGLTPGEWQILDAFEDDDYDLRPIPLQAPPPAPWTYLWTGPVAQDNWDAPTFARTHLASFVEHTREWRTAALNE
ncbi:gamma-glutamylcyclotransferase [Nocardia brasiliensis]|uniref:Putative gamma-glutamylcyclotransferase n=1 Tax=Nocardia brasiliensis TaxID=37326 RepID=A0A6G9XVQ3_NOCBR|nr:gamma-glutamylcyclotransferase family protein [Nocardia brasiliensis]QIS05014.1 gamma-glutamylcyclotransferase [Nocardia brasiliensis]